MKLEIKNLNHNNIFKDLSFTIENKFVLIASPNKCGKTTLLKMIEKDIKTNNSIYIDEVEINELNYIKHLKNVKMINTNTKYKYETLKEEIEHEKYLYKEEIDIKKLLNRYSLTKYKNISELDNKNKILFNILLSLISKPKLLLIDDIGDYFEYKELEKLINLLNEEDINIIWTSSNLNVGEFSDYIYILADSMIILEGTPKDVMKHENIINKIGLSLPFMADLSVKLIDYKLISDIEFNMEEMVNKLWK